MKIKIIVCLCVFFFTFKNEVSISQTVKIGKIELANTDLKGSIDDRFTFKEIQEYLESNKGWRLPTVDELILIYENKNKLGVNGNFYLAHGLNSENNLSSGILYTYNNAYRKYFYIDFFKSKLELKENLGGIDYYIRLVRSNDNQNINNNMSSNMAKSTGCVKGDCYYGYGELVRPSGLTYKGYFKDGYRHGKGFQKYPQGDIYDGDWVNDQPYGKGIYKYTNGNIFEGGIANGLKWGKGKFTFYNGDTYDGDWAEDKKWGKGIYKFANGAYYDGDWVKDEFWGRGIYKFSDGSYYNGTWKNGIKEGSGEILYSDGGKYVGALSNNERHGYGVHIWKTGDKYEGEWKNGQVSGYGKYTNSNGEIVEGIFESGNLIKSKETIDQERQIQEKAQEERILQLAKQKEEEKKQQEEQNIRNAALLMYLFKIAAENQKSLTKNQTSKTNLYTNSPNEHQSVSHEPKWIDVKCTNCNVEFKFKIWKGGQYESGNYWGGWGDETNTRSGYVKCKGCTGYGINWDYDGKNPTKTNCKNWSCSNGWDKCSKCNGTGTIRELH